ncbi:MAG: HAD family hydrolase [Eubacteriales bacterium]
MAANNIYALFDLDGTLTDPSLGITNSILYALENMGRELPPRESLYRFIGPPLLPAFQEFLGMTPEEAGRALVLYREYFAKRGLFENEPYPGIADALASLHDRGVTLAVATSKPEPFAVQILDHFGLSAFFTCVCGATLDQNRTQKADIIAYALNCLGLTGDAKARVRIPMVGDRRHDIEGARANHLSSIGVLWGFGTEEELRSAGADALAHDMEELVERVLS